MLNIQHDHCKIDVILHRVDKYIWRIKNPQHRAESALTRSWHWRGVGVRGQGLRFRRQMPPTSFSCSTEVKGVKEQQKEQSDTSNEELIMLRTPLLPGPKHRPHISPCCVLQRAGDTRKGQGQLRGAQPMSHLELSVHNLHLRLITLLFAGQKFLLPAQQEAQHWLLPFFSYRELVKLPLCQTAKFQLLTEHNYWAERLILKIRIQSLMFTRVFTTYFHFKSASPLWASPQSQWISSEITASE